MGVQSQLLHGTLGFYHHQWVRETRCNNDGCILGHKCLSLVYPSCSFADTGPTRHLDDKQVCLKSLYPPPPFSCFWVSLSLLWHTSPPLFSFQYSRVLCSMTTIGICFKSLENLIPYLTNGNTSPSNLPRCPGLAFCAEETEFARVHPIAEFPTMLYVSMQTNTVALIKEAYWQDNTCSRTSSTGALEDIYRDRIQILYVQNMPLFFSLPLSLLSPFFFFPPPSCWGHLKSSRSHSDPKTLLLLPMA